MENYNGEVLLFCVVKLQYRMATRLHSMSATENESLSNYFPDASFFVLVFQRMFQNI